MNEEFKNSLNKFLEKETYIVAYRSNYDSARQFNNELIDYIKQLQQENQQLKEKVKQLKLEKDAIMNAYFMSRTKLKTEKRKRKAKVKEVRDKRDKYKSIVDKIKLLLDHQMDYREFVDVIVAIESVIKESDLNGQ